ncbi:MAG: penicillin-binding protein 2 [Pseudomonadota bacterium]
MKLSRPKLSLPKVAFKREKSAATSSTRSRAMLVIFCFIGVYAVIFGRLVQYGLDELPVASAPGGIDRSLSARPDITDRNGVVLASDLQVASLYGDPKKIWDVDEAVESLATVFPDMDFAEWHRRLSSGAGFVWLRREVRPSEQAAVMALGIPGLGFRQETQRFYPQGPVASHILGLVDIDNSGLAGMEKFIDDQGLAMLQELGLTDRETLEPVALSIDSRVQHIVHDELTKAMERFQAIAAGAVVLNAKTGEVVAMASLPDYDPNNPFNVNEKDRLNRMSGGVFEMGSTFKAFTAAMALDSGKVGLNDRFDARRPIRIGGFTINDFHGKRRVLSVPEVFIYSSNIGTAKMADVVGIEGQREFLHRLGLLSRMETELPEVARPTEPKKWKKINSITISFGHGVSTTPLQTAVAGAALVNGGKLFQPTFLKRGEAEANASAERVISEETSKEMRFLFRYNVEGGSGRRSDVEGYFVGGKTGTAEKVVNGRYSGDHRFNAFLSAFPMDDPEYVVLVIIDEPKPAEGQRSATAGLNAAPMVGNIIRRSATMLGVEPRYNIGRDLLLAAN